MATTCMRGIFVACSRLTALGLPVSDMGRRRFLASLAAATLGGVGLARYTPTPTPTPTPTVGKGVKIPAGVRLRGVNIVQSFSHIGSQDNGNGWQAEWRNFQWDSWWKPQIDDAATVGNAVRIWGDPHCVTNGSITLATYLAEFKQVLDYCATKGLYVYPTGNVLGFTTTQADDIIAPWATLLKQYPNIIGVDQSNETWGQWWGGGYGGYTQANIDLVQYYCDTIRTNSGLPVSNSFPLTDSGQWTWDGGTMPVAPLFAMSDFVDYHVYAASTPAQVAAGLAMPWNTGKRMIIGEFGRNIGAGDRTAFYANIAALVNGVPQIDAALNWSCWDINGADPSWQFGLFDAARQLRTDIATPFATLPTTA